MKLVPVDKLPKRIQNIALQSIQPFRQVDPVSLLDGWGEFWLPTLKTLKETCIENNGVGLHAAQLGIPFRIYIACTNLKVNRQTYEYFVNTDYVEHFDSLVVQSLEGCLSLPGEEYLVNRWDRVCVYGYKLIFDEDLKESSFQVFSQNLVGMPAIIHQHEIDHSYNILIKDLQIKGTKND